ncbi:MAG TPA: nitroreductase family protein, partial [Bacillota bacterium]|nr:nitroreductase family protein [Bacillota bacterium]
AESVETQLVIEAIEMAQKAPSACNRQPGKVYIIEDQRIKDEITGMHPGNNGFGELADKYLVITGALSCYGGIEERNQVYIDGSLFAMTLIEALHFKGIGSCALHWGGVPRAEVKLRKLVKILPSESILMLVAIGKYPAEFLVAKSCKKNPEDLYRVI